MNLQKKAAKYSSYFVSGVRDNGDPYVYLKDAPEELQKAVQSAHDDRLPDDWIYGTFADLLQRIAEYENDDIDDIRHEIVDGYVDIYTHDLTKWLHNDNRNVYYLGEAMKMTESKDGFQLLMTAQYIAIDEVMNHVVNLLEKDHA